jgi:hypothetical protein
MSQTGTDTDGDAPNKWFYSSARRNRRPLRLYVDEQKLDGYRVIAFNQNREGHLRSRNDNHFIVAIPSRVRHWRRCPTDHTGGEVVPPSSVRVLCRP